MCHLENVHTVYTCADKKTNSKVPSPLSNILVPDPIIPKALLALSFSIGKEQPVIFFFLTSPYM